MPWNKLTTAVVSKHPGSSSQEVAEEPNWAKGHNLHHRIGYRNAQGRNPGYTHDGDHDPYEKDEDRQFREEAIRKYKDLQDRAGKGALLNFQDIMKHQTDFHQHRPDCYPPGFRFVVTAREDWVKQEEDWPANIKQREKEEQKKKEAQKENQQQQQNGDTNQQDSNDKQQNDDEESWRRSTGKAADKQNGAYSKSKDGSSDQNGGQQNGNGEHKTEYQKLRERYSPEEITLLRHLQHERDQTIAFKQNDGKQDSPVKYQAEHKDISIEAQDAMTPDNWIPRSGNLVRRTGQHPLNAEPRLEAMFKAGLITPNELHYVRNHGAVPRLFWDTHVLDVCDGALKLSMDDLAGRFEPINMPVALACDGNRRGELNKLKKSKGFDWGPGAVSCAYWKGALLWQVLEAAGVERDNRNGQRKWVNFEGADEPSEGKYQTSIPLDYALDRGNDVLLAYEMNNTKLPADHGFPLRLIIPGWVGGRCIKWLARVWVTDHENDSYYHIWDNRVLPSFITEKDGEFARTMFHHPSTACNEQNLNSVIVHPGQGEKLDLVDVLEKDTYRVEGYAYDGAGHEVQRVELSIDGGNTWLYCVRKFPDRPIRNGNKFWTWIYWHIDIDAAHFVRADALIVRCFNVFKNTQPEQPVWNTMGMMNNGWYKVKTDTDEDGKLVFRHPFHQEDSEGWMKPSTENQLAAAKQDSGVPDKQFTRQEVEKHNSKEDCWLVINGNVYDSTSVLSWHPGGSATLLANAGKLSLEVTSSFESIHDEYAHKKLSECVIGRVTDKAQQFMKEQAKAEAEQAAKAGPSDTLLQSKKWVPVELVDRKKISEDTFTYTFSYRGDPSRKKLGLGTCQHIQFGIHMLDKLLIRSYTPTRPITEKDDDGTFELTVKTYYPDENQPGGAFSNFLLELPIGESVDVCGPTGEIEYLGNGKFDIEGQERHFSKISLVLGGSGLTPGYSLIERILKENDGKTQVRIVDANKTEDDILLHEKLDEAEKQSQGKIKITHVLSHPKDADDWKQKGGLSGHVNADIIKERLFAPEKDSVVLLCGPPGMIQKAALPALKDWGYTEDENCFGF
ncbi:hypothetical protein PMZ80_004383 [Knufia obscura]|uniref:Nitrate reductase [NADPH] n=1 Tax=Knufia obscura TaxID=1635080 RepID=A0ABR0RRZ0_9EURO|nr:hypothetical protein PMZ80_004383 [Knufia obscura]